MNEWMRLCLILNEWMRQNPVHNEWMREYTIHNERSRQYPIHNKWTRQYLIHNEWMRQYSFLYRGIFSWWNCFIPGVGWRSPLAPTTTTTSRLCLLSGKGAASALFGAWELCRPGRWWTQSSDGQLSWSGKARGPKPPWKTSGLENALPDVAKALIIEYIVMWKKNTDVSVTAGSAIKQAHPGVPLCYSFTGNMWSDFNQYVIVLLSYDV